MEESDIAVYSISDIITHSSQSDTKIVADIQVVRVRCDKMPSTALSNNLDELDSLLQVTWCQSSRVVCIDRDTF